MATATSCAAIRTCFRFADLRNRNRTVCSPCTKPNLQYRNLRVAQRTCTDASDGGGVVDAAAVGKRAFEGSELELSAARPGQGSALGAARYADARSERQCTPCNS